MAVEHAPYAVSHGRAGCTCGWTSKARTSNIRKSWRQHVTRGTK